MTGSATPLMRLNHPSKRVKQRSEGRRSLLLSLELFKVELKFLAFKNVAVEAAGLARAGRDASIQATTVKLIRDLLINLPLLDI